MHELGIGIVAGLVAGLLTALVIIVIREYWIKVILPWYENRIYKDARIEGRWIATYGAIKNKEIIDLQRTGHTVTGRITATEGLDQGKVYDLKGTFNNLILSGLYVPTDARSLDRGSFSLMLVFNGERLEGHTSYYTDWDHKIVSDTYSWVRETGSANTTLEATR